MKIGEGAFEQVNTGTNVEIIPHVGIQTTGISYVEQQRHEHIAHRMAGSTAIAAGYVGYTIMYHPVLGKCGPFVAGDFAGFEAATTVDAHIDDDAAGRMLATMSSLTTTGVRPLAEPNAPTAISQVFSCLANILGSITEVHTR